MADQKWLEGYSGQSVDQLIAMAADHRIDSIVLAFESALMQRADLADLSAFNEAELTILAVEAMEREVNNGGYHQFFLNTPEYAPHLVAASQRIGCPQTATISAKAISLRAKHENDPHENFPSCFTSSATPRITIAASRSPISCSPTSAPRGAPFVLPRCPRKRGRRGTYP